MGAPKRDTRSGADLARRRAARASIREDDENGENVSMTRTFWKSISWPLLVAGLSAPIVMNCGGVPHVAGMPDVPGKANCPDMTSIDAVTNFDWTTEFKIDAKVGAKLKGGVAAAVEMKMIADGIDADLKTACNGILTGLGGTAVTTSGQDACKAAVTQIGAFKAKLGANAKISVAIDPPVCGVSVDAMADCAAKCDASVKPGSADVKCEGGELQGSCSAQCSGSCDVEAGAKCSGSCSGSCDATVSGTCSGKCSGKCDGKATPGGGGASCAGKCDGKCDGKISGTCSGSCKGSCKMSAAASCSGTCSGSCSAKMTAPRCTGQVTPPEMSADCKGSCKAQLDAKVECTPAHIAVAISGAADATAAATFQTTLETNLPAIVKVAMSLKDRLVHLAGDVKAVAEGGIAVVGELKGSVGSDPAKVASAGQLVACVTAPFQGAIDAAASVQANVSVSVNVSASASASGSAGGHS
jgi:hypothetical protein